MPPWMKFWGFATRCKPLVTLKKSKARLDFNRKHLNAPAQFGKILLSESCEEKSMELMIHHTLQHHLSNMVDTVLWHRYAWLPVTSVYWRWDCWQRWQDELWGVHGHTVCSDSVKCWKTEFHITNLRVQYIQYTWNSYGELNRLTVAEWPHCRLYITLQI